MNSLDVQVTEGSSLPEKGGLNNNALWLAPSTQTPVISESVTQYGLVHHQLRRPSSLKPTTIARLSSVNSSKAT